MTLYNVPKLISVKFNARKKIFDASLKKWHDQRYQKIKKWNILPQQNAKVEITGVTVAQENG